MIEKVQDETKRVGGIASLLMRCKTNEQERKQCLKQLDKWADAAQRIKVTSSETTIQIKTDCGIQQVAFSSVTRSVPFAVSTAVRKMRDELGFKKVSRMKRGELVDYARKKNICLSYVRKAKRAEDAKMPFRIGVVGMLTGVALTAGGFGAK